MKITIIKKSTKSAKPQGSCDFYVDDYPNGQAVSFDRVSDGNGQGESSNRS